MRLEDVADRARVSISTVSRVLSNTGRVSERTRTRVLKVAEALRYQPDIRARTLAAGKSKTLGLVVSNLQNPFFVDIISVIDADAHRAGYAVALASTDYRPQKFAAAVQWMLGHRLAGLALVVSEEEAALVDSLASETIPVAFYGVAAAGPNVTNVRTDDCRGMKRVAEYLHALGHRRFAFVGHDARLKPLQDRRTFFLEAVARLSGSIESTAAHGSDSPAGGSQATRQLLSAGFMPSAIICASDFMALGVLKALREHGLAVPGDVSVVGYGNIRLSEYTTPPLTTVDVPREQIGHAVSSALLAPAGGARDALRDIILEPELIIRESTGPAA